MQYIYIKFLTQLNWGEVSQICCFFSYKSPHGLNPESVESEEKKSVNYRNDHPTNLTRQIWSNSVDPDQTAPAGPVRSGSTPFAILSASFGCITVWFSRVVAQFIVNSDFSLRITDFTTQFLQKGFSSLVHVLQVLCYSSCATISPKIFSGAEAEDVLNVSNLTPAKGVSDQNSARIRL